MLERERTTDHDVAAFVDVVQAAIGAPAGSWIHFGLTSSDVVDTALCWAMRDATDVVLATTDELLTTLVGLARTHLRTVMIGRTHGIHAEPTTFGAKVGAVGAAAATATAPGSPPPARPSPCASCRARSGRTRTSTRRWRSSSARGSA